MEFRPPEERRQEVLGIGGASFVFQLGEHVLGVCTFNGSLIVATDRRVLMGQPDDLREVHPSAVPASGMVALLRHLEILEIARDSAAEGAAGEAARAAIARIKNAAKPR